MNKYRSDWIERNVYYCKDKEEGGIPHYKSYERPVIVCLCGSTRFWREFQEASLRETLAGKIVLSIGAARCADADDKSFGGYVPVSEWDKQKESLDQLHKEKINLCDEVLVLNVDGYIGESTRSEIEHAEKGNKIIRYLEEPK